MKKLIASDYDRTLYLDDEDIQKNKQAIDEFTKLGNNFIIATGRSYFDFMKKVKQYGLTYDFAIINHGATILDRNDVVIFNMPMDNSIIPQLERDLELEKSTMWFCCSQLESRVDFDHKDLTKINVKYVTKKKSMEMNEKINLKYSDFVSSFNITSSSIEIVSNKIDKSKAIQMIADKLKVENNNIYTIGDGYSDVQMIKDYNGYCMLQSVDELKDSAMGQFKSVSELVNKVININ